MTSRRPYWCTQNNETVAMLVYQENPLGVKLFFNANAFFCSNKICIDAAHVSGNTLKRYFAR